MNFEDLRTQYDIIPVVRELSADALTPLAAFAALAGATARRSCSRASSGERTSGATRSSDSIRGAPCASIASTTDPARLLRDELVPLRVYGEENAAAVLRRRGRLLRLRRRPAGASGSPTRIRDDIGVPDAKLLFFDNVVVFDHVRQRMLVVANLFTADCARVDRRGERADRPRHREAARARASSCSRFRTTSPTAEFTPNVHARRVRADGARREGGDRRRRDLPDRPLAAVGAPSSRSARR